MTEEDVLAKKENEELLEMFSTPGWKHLMKKCDEIIEPLEDVRNIQSWEDACIKKGELRNMDWLKNFPDLVRLALDDL